MTIPYTIPWERDIHTKIYVSRADGYTWEDLLPFTTSVEISSGNVTRFGGRIAGIDGVMPQLDLVLRQDPDNKLNPQDQNSSWNKVSGQYNPLLAPMREIMIVTATTSPGVQPSNHDWIGLFHGYLGDGIRVEGDTVRVNCRSLSKLLQDTYIENPKNYGSEGGTPLEQVMQDVLDDNGLCDVVLYCPEPTGFMVETYSAEQVQYKTVWDVLQALATAHDFFLGDLWDPNTERMRLTLLVPPRDKDVDTADFVLNYRSDFLREEREIRDTAVRNVIIGHYWDKDANEKRTITVKDDASISQFGRRAMEVEEEATSLIQTEAEMLTFLNAILSDLKDQQGTSYLSMPFFPQIGLFSGLVIHHPAMSSTNDFMGVESFRHTLDFAGKQFRTEIVGSGRIRGGQQRWLKSETKPGSPGYPSTPPTSNVPPANVAWGHCSFITDVSLNWEPVRGATAYEIRTEDQNWGYSDGIVYRGNGLSHRFTPTQRSHTFYIKAVNQAGLYSNQATPITLSLPAPAAPDQPHVLASFRALQITTEPLNSSSVIGYTLYVTEGSNTIEIPAVAGQPVLYTADPNTTVTIQVAARDIIGEGPKSEPLQSTTVGLSGLDTPPGGWEMDDLSPVVVGEINLAKTTAGEALAGLGDLDGRVDGAFAEIGGAKDRLTTAEAELGGVVTRLTDAEDGLSGAFAEIGGAKDRLTTAEAELGGVVTRLTDAEGGLSGALDGLVDLQSEVEGIEIGGRNLAFGTADDDWRQYTAGTALTRSDGDRTKVIRATRDSDAVTIFGIQQRLENRRIKLKQGETYTLSFLARGNIPSLNYVYLMNTGTNNQNVPDQVLESETDFRRIKITFVANSRTGASAGSYIMISKFGNGVVGEWFEIQEVKLERGNKATDWTPAPEDTDAKFTAVDATLLEHEDWIEARATKTEVRALEGDVATVSQQVGALEVSYAGISGEVSSLSGTVDTLTGEVSGVSSQVGALELRADGFDTSISEVLQAVDGHTTTLSDHQTQISQNATNIGLRATKTELQNTEAGLTTLIDDVSELVVGPGGVVASVSSLNTRMDDAEDELTTLNNAVFEVLPGQISAKADTTVVEGLNARVSSAEQDISALDGAITTTVTELSTLRDVAAILKPEGAKLWHFDTSLDSTDGIKPLDGAVATLRPGEGRFGGAVAVEEGTENLIDHTAFRMISNNAASYPIQEEPFGEHRRLRRDPDFETYPSNYLSCYGNIGSTPGAEEGETYTSCIKVKPELDVGLRIYSDAGPYVLCKAGRWTTLTRTFVGTARPLWLQSSSAFGVDFNPWIEYKEAQVEQKPFATSFVDGVRGGSGGIRQSKDLVSWDAFTISGWTRIDGLASQRHVIVEANHGSHQGNRFLFMPNNSGQRYFYIMIGDDAGSAQSRASKFAFTDGEWFHWAITFDGNSYKAYFDGALDIVYNQSRKVVLTEAATLRFGGGGSWGILNGLIDELLILPYAATDEEIRSWYEAKGPFVDQSEINYQATQIQQLSDRWGVTVDINGNVAGVNLLGDTGEGSVFSVLADRFRVANPSTGAQESVFVVEGGDTYVRGKMVVHGLLRASEAELDLLKASELFADFAVFDEAHVMQLLTTQKMQTHNAMAGMSGQGTAGSSVRFWAGDPVPEDAPYQVLQSGKLKATDAELSGVFRVLQDDQETMVAELSKDTTGGRLQIYDNSERPLIALGAHVLGGYNTAGGITIYNPMAADPTGEDYVFTVAAKSGTGLTARTVLSILDVSRTYGATFEATALSAGVAIGETVGDAPRMWSAMATENSVHQLYSHPRSGSFRGACCGGSYYGNGSDSRHVRLPFDPSLVIVRREEVGNQNIGILTYSGCFSFTTTNLHTSNFVANYGFVVSTTGIDLNKLDVYYEFTAFM